MNYSIPRNQLVSENIVKLLTMAKEIEQDYILWGTWLRCVASSLYLEDKFRYSFDLIENAYKKAILINLNGLSDINIGSWTRQDALKWCSVTYDASHQLRFSVETLDSIEDVRLFLEPLKERNIGLHNLLKLKYKYKWKLIYE